MRLFRREYTDFDDFFDGLENLNEKMPPTPATRAVEALSAVIAIAITLVVVPAAVAVPAAYTINAVATESVDLWESVPVDVPDVPDVLPGTTTLYDINGEPFAQFYAENRVPVEFEDVSEHLVNAIVAIEDRRFWDHHGVDGESVARAAQANLEAGTTVQGASTLTQQLVENLKLAQAVTDEDTAAARAQSLTGKVIEMKTAMELEEQMSKEDILTAYMNLVYFGGGSYGVAAAADRFFGVDVADLTIAQAATVAGLVNEPTGLNPLTSPDAAQVRRDLVLDAMLDEGYITISEHNEAVMTPMDTSNANNPPNGCAASDYEFYCEIVRDALLDDYRLGYTQRQRDEAFYTGHLAVHTAMDPAVMASIDDAISTALSADNRVASASAVVEPGTGLVLGIGQSRDWGQGENETEIPYAMSAFQPGSTWKAIILASALEQGLSADTVYSTAPYYKPYGFDFPSGGFSNFGRYDYGSLDAFNAARLSSNVWFVKALQATGVNNAVEMAKAMGVNESLDGVSVSSRSLSFALGSWEVSPVEMASVYATIASAGSSCEPVFITDVVDETTGESLPAERTECQTVYSESTATTMMDVLQMPFQSGGTADELNLPDRQAIGKTGTTTDYASAWFAGATPQYAAAVWVGDPRGGYAYPLRNVYAYGNQYYDHVFGSDIPGHIWQDLMTDLTEGTPVTQWEDVEQRPMAARTLADLVDQPNVAGMQVLEAASLLMSMGYEVHIEQATVMGVDSDVVASSVFEGAVAALTIGAGSDRTLLGSQVTEDMLILAAGQDEGVDQ